MIDYMYYMHDINILLDHVKSLDKEFDTDSMREKIRASVETYARRDILSLYVSMLYSLNEERMRTDIAKHKMLKSPTKLSNKERQQCLFFICDNFWNKDDIAYILKDLEESIQQSRKNRVFNAESIPSN